MPAIIEQLPTSDDEDQTTPPTETHDVAQRADTDQQNAPVNATDEPGERIVDLELCGQLKNAGNQHFKEGNISEALASYRRALWYAPIKPVPARPAQSKMPKPLEGAEEGENRPESATDSGAPSTSAAQAAADAEKGEKAADDKSSEDESVDTTDYTLTSQVYCNAGFCLMKLDVKEEAAQMLSEAIRHDEQYVKAYLRRADCYYDLQKWSNAYGDYENYEKLGGVLDAQGRARKTAAKAKVDEEMQKMLGELKNIGNKILGNFGLSTDNFKFDKDPNTGGYSMRFER